MKYFCIFFSVYIFLLSTIPCGDERDCNKLTTYQTEIVANDHSSHQHEQETCSPFCICTCCGNVAIHLLAAYEIQNTEANPDQTISPEISNTQEVSLAIWQPPKIA